MIRTEERLRTLLVVFAVSQIALGLTQWIVPGTFFDRIGPFGPRNDHYLGDVASWYIALGVTVLAAAGRRSWRVPILTFAALQYSLHSLNHLIDVGEADPGWLGPADLVALVLTAGLLVWMLRAAEDLG
jgi:hypothetical protein